jgi:hypothetical protein
MIGKGTGRKWRFYQGFPPETGLTTAYPCPISHLQCVDRNSRSDTGWKLCYATLGRRVVAVGFVGCPKGDHLATTPHRGWDGASPYPGFTPLLCPSQYPYPHPESNPLLRRPSCAGESWAPAGSPSASLSRCGHTPGRISSPSVLATRSEPRNSRPAWGSGKLMATTRNLSRPTISM